jgi:cytochrome P450
MPSAIDIMSEGFRHTPHPALHALRQEGPLHHLEKPDAWLVTDYPSCVSVLRDRRCVPAGLGQITAQLPDECSRTRGLVELAHSCPAMMILRDAPEHSRLRRLASTALTPQVAEKLASRVQRMIADLLDSVGSRGYLDLVDDFASPLSLAVIGELLGLPEADRLLHQRWSKTLVPVVDGSPLLGGLESTLDAAAQLISYLDETIAQRHIEPRDDLISAMVLAQQHGGSLDDDELARTLVLLFVAGAATTTNLIANGLLALLRERDGFERLRRQPGLIRNGVEEMLRFGSPVFAVVRRPSVDLELSGRRIRAGQELILVLGAANRDPAQFPSPDRFDVTRTDNRHIALGLGPHFCLGAPLTRLQAQLAVRELLRRFPDLALAPNGVSWSPGLGLRGVESLPVVC